MHSYGLITLHTVAIALLPVQYILLQACKFVYVLRMQLPAASEITESDGLAKRMADTWQLEQQQ